MAGQESIVGVPADIHLTNAIGYLDSCSDPLSRMDVTLSAAQRADKHGACSFASAAKHVVADVANVSDCWRDEVRAVVEVLRGQR
jgi:hypothetical protein